MRNIIIGLFIILSAINPNMTKHALNTTVDLTHNIIAKTLGTITTMTYAADEK
jgi:hypothetical protein